MLIRKIKIQEAGGILEATVAIPKSNKIKMPIVFIPNVWEGKDFFVGEKPVG